MLAVVKFKDYLREAQAQAAVVLPQHVLRPSALPYCGLRNAVGEITGKQNLWDFFANYYTGVGSAVHEVLQMHMGLTGTIWGDWECLECGYIRQLKPYAPCRRCGSQMQYNELTLKYKGIPGHLDGLFCVTVRRRGKKIRKFYVIDYKTSSYKVIDRHQKSLNADYLPYHYNKRQVEAYCVMIEATYNIKIEGWLLIYLCRDNPSIFEVVGEEIDANIKRQIARRLRGYVHQHQLFSNLNTKTLTQLIADKPCCDKEFYEHEYHSMYNPCIVASDGLCFRKDLKQHVLKMYRQHVLDRRQL